MIAVANTEVRMRLSLELRLAKIDGVVVTQIEFFRQLGREMILRTWIHNGIDLFGFIDK